MFIPVDDSERARRALDALAQAFTNCTVEQVDEALAELRARAMKIGVERPAVLIECTICGTQRSVEPMQLGWLLYCDVCGHQLAEPDNPWTRSRADRPMLRDHAPFSQVTGTLQRTPLRISVALSSDLHRLLPAGTRPLYISARPDHTVAIGVENTGPMPIPGGYLSCRSLGGDIHGPRPLLSMGERADFHVFPPEVATSICIDFHPPRGALKNISTIQITPLGDVSWRVREAEPGDFISMNETAEMIAASPRFVVDVRFSNAPPTAGAKGHLQLRNHTFSLRCRPSSVSSVHEWAAALDVSFGHRADFEVKLSYPELIGDIRLRGTLMPHGEVPSPRLIGQFPSPALTRPEPEGHAGVSMRWGIPLVIDSSASGVVAGFADGQKQLRSPPVTEVESIIDAAAALQIRPDTTNAMDDATVGDTRSVLVAGTLGVLDHMSMSMIELGRHRLGSLDGSRALETFSRIARGLLRQANDRQAGRLGQIALLLPPTMSAYRLDVVRDLLARAFHDVRVYTDIDRASALAVHHLFGGRSHVAEAAPMTDVMVFDVSYEQTAISIHRVVASPASEIEPPAEKPEFLLKKRAAATIEAGYLEVLDAFARLVLEPLLHDEPIGDEAMGSVETSGEDPVWLFSPERREAWLKRTSTLTATESAAIDPRGAAASVERAQAVRPQPPVSPVRKTILRLLAVSVLARLGEQDRAEIAGVQYGELLTAHLLKEDDFADADLDERRLLERCSVPRKVIRRALKSLAGRLVEPARPVVDAFLRWSSGGARRVVLIHGPALLCEGIRRHVEVWRTGASASSSVDVVSLASEEAPALLGAMAYYESARLGMLNVRLRMAPPVDRHPFAVESLTPVHRTIIPIDSPVPLAVGYVAITHPAVILGLRYWFDEVVSGERMALSLDSLVYRDEMTFDDLCSAARSTRSTLALKVTAKGTPEAEDLIIECEVVELAGGALSQIESALRTMRSQFDDGHMTHIDASALPSGVDERVRTVRPIEILRRPLDIAAPVDFSDATLD